MSKLQTMLCIMSKGNCRYCIRLYARCKRRKRCLNMTFAIEACAKKYGEISRARKRFFSRFSRLLTMFANAGNESMLFSTSFEHALLIKLKRLNGFTIVDSTREREWLSTKVQPGSWPLTIIARATDWREPSVN